jgi:hypothetical protein
MLFSFTILAHWRSAYSILIFLMSFWHINQERKLRQGLSKRRSDLEAYSCEDLSRPSPSFPSPHAAPHGICDLS